MIENMILESQKFMPLIIERLEWSGDILTFGGKKWNFSTVSSWRIVSRGKVDYACFDTNISNELNRIINKSIVKISFQSTLLKVDPIFFLSDGSALEIFATDTYEPWVFHIGNLGMYIATPGEPKAFDIRQ